MSMLGSESRRPAHRWRRGIVGGLFGLLALLLVASTAGAVDRSPLYPRFDRAGAYVGVGGTYQYNVFHADIEDVIQDQIDDALLGANSSVELDDSGGIDALVGYRLWSFFAVELQYQWVDEYDVKGTIETPVPASGRLYSIEGHTLTASTKWILPTWRIQPYLLLGGGVAISDVKRGNLNVALEALDALGGGIDDRTNVKPAGRAGIGVDLYVTRHIVVYAQGSVVVTTFEKPDIGNADDLNYMGFTAGLQYRF